MKSPQKLEQTNHMMQPQHPIAHIQRTQSAYCRHLYTCVHWGTVQSIQAMYICTCTIACLRRSEDSFVESYLFDLYVDSKSKLGFLARMAGALHAEPFYQPHSCLSYLCVREWNFLLLVGPYRICFPMLVSHVLFVCVPFKRGQCQCAPVVFLNELSLGSGCVYCPLTGTGMEGDSGLRLSFRATSTIPSVYAMLVRFV